MSSKIQIIINLMSELSVTINDINDYINNPINKLIAKPNTKILWGDIDNESDDEQYVKIQKITTSTTITEEKQKITETTETEKIEIIENIINETIDNLVENSMKAIIQHVPNKGWNTVVLNNIQPIAKTEIPKTKVVKTNTSTLPVINNLAEFCEMIKEKKQLFKDFLINPNAHCSHTFNGTLCPNVHACGKIHIQRCVFQNKCSNKTCSYLHLKNMKTEDAKINYMNTMNKYKQIKYNKHLH